MTTEQSNQLKAIYDKIYTSSNPDTYNPITKFFVRHYLDVSGYIVGISGACFDLTYVDKIYYSKYATSKSGNYSFNLVKKNTHDTNIDNGTVPGFSNCRILASDITVSSAVKEYDVSNLTGEYYIYYKFSGSQYVNDGFIVYI